MIERELYTRIIEELRIDGTILKMSKDTKAKIEAYLKGETGDISLFRVDKNFYTDIFSTLLLQFKGDNRELARRAFIVASQLYPSKVYHFFQFQKDVFHLYHEIGFNDDFVLESIVEIIYSKLEYYGNPLRDSIKDWLHELSAAEKREHMFSQLFLYYNHLIEKIFQKQEYAKAHMAQIILSALSMKWYGKDAEKKQAFLLETQTNIYGMMKSVYPPAALEKAMEEAGSDESKKMLIETPESTVFCKKKLIEKALLILCGTFYQESPILLDAYKVCLMEVDTNSYLKQYDIASEALEKQYKEFGISAFYCIKLYAGQILEETAKAQWEIHAAKLEMYLKEYESLFISCYTFLKKRNDARAIILAAVLAQNGKITTQSIEEAENHLVKKLEALLKKLKENKNIQLQWITTQTIESLRNEKFVVDEIERKRYYFYDRDLGELMVCAISLYDVSVCARNIVAMLIHIIMGAWGNGFTIFQRVYSMFCISPEENKYETLSKKIGVTKTIEYFMDFSNKTEKEKASFCAFLKNHKEEGNQILTGLMKEDGEFVISFIDCFFSKKMEEPEAKCVFLFEHKQKMVLSFLEEYLLDKESTTREEVEKYKASKNKNTKEAVLRLLRAWDEGKLNALVKEIKTPQEAEQFIKEHFQAIKKLPFESDIDFESIRYAETQDKADAAFLHYYLTEYMLLKDLRIIPYCEELKKFLNPLDFSNFMKTIYQTWLENGADTKQKNILLPYALSCDGAGISELKKQIDTWTENSRGALAAFAVTAMALNGSNIALLLTESISQKYKNKQVKNAASQAMEEVAEVLHITKEELGDRIVPNLGFDKNRVKWFDYGSRKFQCILNEKLELSLVDEKGKKIKALPKPNSNDDMSLAELAKDEWKSLKKQLKTVVNTQKARLEHALLTSRSWSKEKWLELFVENPIMNGFAVGLVWVEHSQQQELLGVFRYMEDGTFNTVDEEEYLLSENSMISLLHPMDLEKEMIEQWYQQLEDYEIVQPIPQLTLPVYTLTEEEKKNKVIKRFENKTVYYGTVKGIVEKYDWKRTSVLDAGGYDGYYYEDTTFDVGVTLTFDCMYVGMMSNDTTKMVSMEFYKFGSITYGSYCYDEITEKNRVLPKDVPPKLLNFALMVGEAIAQKEMK